MGTGPRCGPRDKAHWLARNNEKEESVTEPPVRKQPKGDCVLLDTLAGVTLDREKPGVISASDTCGGTLRGPSSRELAAVPMPDDRARMENAKKEKVARCLTWFWEPLSRVPTFSGLFSTDKRFPLRT